MTITAEPDDHARSPRAHGAWLTFATLIATVPVHGLLSSDKAFYIRDLALFFWGRYLWFRRSLWNGTFPLWDPYLGAGQSFAADALNQAFFLPTVVVRSLGTETLGFNLWVGLPLPLAAAGAFLMLSRRFAPAASCLGAVVFATSGPVVSTLNFPNLSWTAASVPWVVWAALRSLDTPGVRGVAGVAVLVGLQALAGEPVTFMATLALVLGVAVVGGFGTTKQGAWRRLGIAGAALILGIGLAAIQLWPLSEAVRDSWRPFSLQSDFWSLHPLWVAEFVSAHLFGNYFEAEHLGGVPWMLPLNSGRDPFFYSVYLGPAVLALALHGVLCSGRRRWCAFWSVVAVTAFVFALGSNTPVFPWLQAHSGLVKSLRFPVKSLIVVCLAAASLVAAGWEQLSEVQRPSRSARRWGGVAFTIALGLIAYGAAAATIYLTTPTAHALYALAQRVQVHDPLLAAEQMLRTLPTASVQVVIFSAATTLFLGVAGEARREARLARWCIFGLISVDLVYHAIGLNPMLPAAYFAEPKWADHVRAHPDARFYVGGKSQGTLDTSAPDGIKRFRRPPGLTPSEARAALSLQMAFYPSGWRLREMLSYDLAVLWPRDFGLMEGRFRVASSEERHRFLDRTAVRYRITSEAAGGTRRMLAALTLPEGLFLFEEPTASPRAFVVTAVEQLPIRAQLEWLFSDHDDYARRATVLGTPERAAGREGEPQAPAAAIARDDVHTVEVDAAAPAGGGYLVLLDSYSPDWTASVDGQPAELLRVNVGFRAVRLVPGRHHVVFDYRPRAVITGAWISAVSCALVLGLFAYRRRARNDH